MILIGIFTLLFLLCYEGSIVILVHINSTDII